MTGQIIRFQGDPHREVQALLPWYLTGRLDEAERARVEAHLGACPECQAEVRSEHRLGVEVASLPAAEGALGVEHGWTQLRRRMELESSRPAPAAWRGWVAAAGRGAAVQWGASAAWLRWAVAAQLVLLLLASAYLVPMARQARYHALGAAPVSAAGNVVVIFRPDAREKDLRAALEANDARLVDGPTAADAYLLHVPAAERSAAVARLRRQRSIELAEPVDSGASP